MKILHGFTNALAFFSRIPVPARFLGKSENMILFLPLVGALFGVLTLLFFHLTLLFFSTTLSLVLSFCFFVYLSGAIHLDGLVDTLDGLFAGKQKAHVALKDPNIGALGAIFLFLFLALKLFAFIELNNLFLFLVVPIISRTLILILMQYFSYRNNGIGSSFVKKLDFKELIFAFFVPTIFIYFFAGFIGLFLLIFCMATIFIVALKLKEYFGTLNGDNYGFCIELSELVALLLLCALF